MDDNNGSRNLELLSIELLEQKDKISHIEIKNNQELSERFSKVANFYKRASLKLEEINKNRR